MIPSVIKQMAIAIHDLGGKLYLVGGCVRDLCLSASPSDWDCEVFGLQQNILEKYLKTNFSTKFVGKDFGVYKLHHEDLKIDVSLPRIETLTGNKHKDFRVVVDPYLPVEKAALRRDFTINSMALDLMNSKLIDPLHGQVDLASKTLRHCSPRFAEDPLRVLRGMQFCARFDLTADSETLSMCLQLTNQNIPKEREWEEWKKLILLGKTPSMGLEFLKGCGWIYYYPALNGMLNSAQDPEWHSEGNVWAHTKLAMDHFAKERTGDSREDLVTGLGVLLHDCGKPHTSAIGDDGRIHSYKHSEVGVSVATHFMSELTDQKDILEDVVTLVKYHMVPMALYPKGKDSTIRRLSTKVPVERLIRVARADHFATGYHMDKDPEWDTWLMERLKSLNISDSKPYPIVMGRHLIEMGIPPGPVMGELLAKTFEAQLDGVILGLDDGKEFVRSMAKAQGLLD